MSVELVSFISSQKKLGNSYNSSSHNTNTLLSKGSRCLSDVNALLKDWLANYGVAPPQATMVPPNFKADFKLASFQVGKKAT